MKKSIAVIVIAFIGLALMINLLSSDDEYYNLRLEELKQKYAIKPVPSVDHSKLPDLQREFSTPQEVTETCIACHTERHKEIMNSAHWNWERVSYVEGRG